MNGTRHTGPAEPTTEMPPEVMAAISRAIAEYEPEAMAAIIASPKHLLGVLLEAGWRTVKAAGPLIISQRESATARSIANAERERIARLAEAKAAERASIVAEDALTRFADLLRKDDQP